jgi:hypothetical protein
MPAKSGWSARRCWAPEAEQATRNSLGMQDVGEPALGLCATGMDHACSTCRELSWSLGGILQQGK